MINQLESTAVYQTFGADHSFMLNVMLKSKADLNANEWVDARVYQGNLWKKIKRFFGIFIGLSIILRKKNKDILYYFFSLGIFSYLWKM